MPITPDTKDWTWVLQRVCRECGFDVRDFPRDDIGEMIRANAAEWQQVPEHPKVRQRPSEDVWSALEYACHVRDVFRLYDHRLKLMLEESNPSYPNWDQDEAAISGAYEDEEPSAVATELTQSAAALAARFDAVEADEWERTGERSDGARFTVESFARYLIHDPIHHLHDVRQGFAKLD